MTAPESPELVLPFGRNLAGRAIAFAGTVSLTNLEWAAGKRAMPTARNPPLSPPSISSGGHQPCGLPLFPVSPEPSHGRGDARGAGHLRELRDGEAFSDQIRQRVPARGDKWHLDEVVISIAGEPYWLWRAVDQNGFVQSNCVWAISFSVVFGIQGLSLIPRSGRFHTRSNSHSVAVRGGCTNIPLAAVAAQEDETADFQTIPLIGSSTRIRQD